MTDPPCRYSRDLLVRCMRESFGPLEPIATGHPPSLAPLPGIDAVLFDVYGTMFVSGSGDIGVAAATASAESLDQSLRAVDLPPLDERTGRRGVELLEQAIRAEHQVRHAAGIAYPEVDIRRIWAQVVDRLRDERLLDPPRACINYERLAVEYECRVNPVWPMPGLIDVLAALNHRGLRLGIVSNSQFYTPLIFQALLERTCADLGFDESLCGWSWQVGQAKPADALFAAVLVPLAERHRIPASRVLYVGNDMRNDIAPAARLGCRTALFAGDRRSLRLRDDENGGEWPRPDRVITDLADLPGLLGVNV